jgi:hypothetical protein
MEYASSVGVSSRRVGVAGLEWDGELYAKSLRRVGVVGGMAVELDGIGAGRVGDTGLRGEGGVTSVCRIELKIALACSVLMSQRIAKSTKSTT